MKPTVDESDRVEAPAHKPAAASPFSRLGETRHLGLVVALVLLAVVGLVTVPDTFATASNMVSILSLAATIGVIT
ncbi:ABC transporter permease, partial [Streptosporangium sp. NPDC048865]